MGTSFIEAMDFSWEYQRNDYFYHCRYGDLSFTEKLIKKISDYLVYTFAWILDVHDDKKIANKKISPIEKQAYKDFVTSKTYTNISHQNLILILNGENEIPVPPKIFSDLEKQSQCQIEFLNVSFVNEIEMRMKELRNKNNVIQALWIRAHGTPFSIIYRTTYLDYDCQGSLNVTPLSEIEKNLQYDRLVVAENCIENQLDQLAPHAPILLESCFTGQPVDGEHENIAQVFARLAKGRIVYAPSREMLPIVDSLSFTIQKGLKVSLKSFQNSKYFKNKTLFSRLEAVLYAFLDRQVDITNSYKCHSNINFYS